MAKPNFFVVGAAKSGTTTICNLLKQHPQVFVSPIKEPNFFGKDVIWNDFREDHKLNTKINFDKYFKDLPLAEKHIAFLDKIENYLKLFKGSKNYLIKSEFSTSYLYSQYAAKEIYDFNKESKILIILRSPIDRTLSHYFMDHSSGKQKEDNILKALKSDYESQKKGYCVSNLYIDLSLYYEQVKRYYEIFPKNQIMILNFEDLQTNIQKSMDGIVDFLELDNFSFDVNQKYNVTLVPKNSFYKKINNLKNILPNFLIAFLRTKKSLFFEKPNKSNVTPDVVNYINMLTEKDWDLCKKTYSFFDGK